jgi:threonine/homoserine/homoserine lactone efflux protein
MDELLALAGIVAALAVGVVSPGPSFVMVARTAVSQSRSHGVAAALGMGAGGAVFAAIALLGLHAVLLAVPSLYVALKVVGGLYLAWLGVRIWRAAKAPLPAAVAAAPAGMRRALAAGFVTQVSNPKTAVVYASVFAAFLPAAHSAGFAAALLAVVFCIEAGWYALVAVALAARAPRQVYLRCKAWMDRLAGGVMVALGLKLAAYAHR